MRSPILFFLAVLMLVIPAYAADETVLITNWNLSNPSSIGIIEITNSTPATYWTFFLPVATPNAKYFLYYPTDDTYVAWAFGGTNVTLSATNLTDGTYQIVGGNIPQMQVTYFNPDNATCNMAFTVDDSTPLNWWNFTLSNVTDGVDYAVYDTNPETLMDRATASGGKAVFNISYLPDGEYWIVEYRPEIYWSYLDPTNTSCYGRFEISNASIGQNWSIKLNNVTSGYTYKLFSNDGVMYATATAGDNVSLNTTGLRNGWYWIGYIGNSDSFVTPSVVVGVSFVIGSAIIASFINKFGRRE